MVKTKGFIPYILVVFFNAFIDLGHKVLLQNTVFNTTSAHEFTILSAILNALILLPYILLFTPSGFIADKYSKAQVLRYSAAAAIPMTLLITVFYYLGYFWAAFVCTLLLSTQSAINSPAKYGYIKEAFGKNHIANANAWVQTTVIIAILSSTFAFTLLTTYLTGDELALIGDSKALMLSHLAPLGFLLIALSITETLLTFALPSQHAADPSGQYKISDYFTSKQFKSYFDDLTQNRLIFKCIIGLALFWGVNQVLLAVYGAYLKTYVPGVTVLFVQSAMATAGIGVLFGAIYAGKLSRGFIEIAIIPVALIGIALGLFLLPNLTNQPSIVLLFLIYGFFGGLLVVPLNALIQFNALKKDLGKIMAGNNFIQNVSMISFLFFTVLATELNFSSLYLLYALFVVAVFGAICAFKRLPQSLIRYGLYARTGNFYYLTVSGLNDFPSSGGVLLQGNATGPFDWALLQMASPRPIRFVMKHAINEKWYMRYLLSSLNTISLLGDTSEQSLHMLKEALHQGDVLALFYENAENTVAGTEVVRIPFYFTQSTKGRTIAITITFNKPLTPAL